MVFKTIVVLYSIQYFRMSDILYVLKYVFACIESETPVIHQSSVQEKTKFISTKNVWA